MNVAEGNLRVEYNFPTLDGNEGVEGMMEHVRSIFHRERNAFHINLSVGMILRNIETGEYRYFVPYFNSMLFNSNIRISRLRDLEAVRRHINRLDIRNYIEKQNLDTKWKPHLITNFVFYVFRTHYPLGQGDLPDYIINSKSIISMHKNPVTGRVYEDALCAFRCLSVHRKDVGGREVAAKKFYRQWRDFRNNSKSAPRR